MATIYFTSNADSGSGTLRDAISSAAADDTIAPDPSVFTSGPITIALSSSLPTLPARATIDGGELGIIIDGQNSSFGSTSAFRATSAGAYTIVNVTLKGYRVTSNAPVMLNTASGNITFKRCKFVENTGVWYGVIYALNGHMNFYDCLITANKSTGSATTIGGLYVASNGTVDFVRSILCGNCNSNVSGRTRITEVGSFIGLTPPEINGVTPEEIGFVNPPPGATIPVADYAAGDWESWDFRLKPTSAYLTGASYQSGDKDLLGHDRTGSWGCYDGSWIVADAIVSSDTTVDYLEISASGTLTLSGSDRILTVSKGVYFTSGGAATSSTRGYIVLPAGASASALTLTNVVACYSGAGASNLSAATTGISWSSNDSTVSVVLELYSGTAWTTITQTSGTSYSTTLAEGAQVRLFDGVNFLTATVPVTPTPSGEVTPFWTIKRWAVVDTSGGTSTGAWDVNSWIVVSAGGSYSVNHWALDPEVE